MARDGSRQLQISRQTGIIGHEIESYLGKKMPAGRRWMSNIRVWGTTKAAYGFVFTHQSDFWRLAALPMVIYYAVFFAVYLVVGVEVVQPVWAFVLLALLGILATPFVVAWHRMVLLGPGAIVGHRGLTYGFGDTNGRIVPGVG